MNYVRMINGGKHYNIPTKARHGKLFLGLFINHNQYQLKVMIYINKNCFRLQFSVVDYWKGERIQPSVLIHIDVYCIIFSKKCSMSKINFGMKSPMCSIRKNVQVLSEYKKL